MAVPAAGMIVQVSFVGNVFLQRVLNVLHWRMTNAWGDLTIESFYNSFHNAIKATGPSDLTTTFLAIHAPEYTLERTRLQVIYPARYRGKDFTSGASGTRTGACTAQNLAAVITKFCELAGRSKRGSIHLGGLVDSDYNIGNISGGLATAMGAWMSLLIQTVFEPGGTGTMTPVIYHPGPNANPKYDVITQLVSQPTLRTQRTRNVGKGE